MNRYLLPFVLTIVLLGGCSSDESVTPSKSAVNFGFSQNLNGRLSEDFDPAAILITIEDSEGHVIFDLKKLTLYNFSGAYLTDTPIELEVGEYTITKCLVVNDQNDITHVVPITGSHYAGLVEHPLPISFSVGKDEAKTINLEVVSVEYDAADYGYVTFSIGEANLIQQLVIDFNLPTPDYFVNEGYDSVVVTLSKGNTVFTKALDILSEDHATGQIEINWSEVVSNDDCEACWNLKVQAFFEVIDAVLEITHTNETYQEREIVLTKNATGIDFSEDAVIVEAPTPFYSGAGWKMQSHFTDNEYYKFTIDNDFCSSRFEYQVFANNVTWLYADKYIYNSEYDWGYKLLDLPLGIQAGTYANDSSFNGICNGVSYDPASTYADMYFYVQAHDIGHACYIVWEAMYDPNDPIKNGRVSGNKGGAFRAVSPEEYKSHRKHN